MSDLQNPRASLRSAATPSAAQPGRAGPLAESELLAAIDKLPSLPTVVERVLSVSGKETSSAGDLDGIIRQDLAITGRLLRMVNSSFYGLSHEVTSITQAVAILGFTGLKSLVLAASTAGMMEQEMSAYGFASKGLWRNSITTAALARDIARRVGASDIEAEEFFAAGLLRDVGMLVLAPFLAKRGATLRRDGGAVDILERERQVLGFDHCWAGERVVEKWRLPKTLIPVVARHHRWQPNAPARELRQIAVVRLAERISYSVGMGVLPDHPFDAKVDPDLVQSTGLDAAGFRRLVAEAPRILREAEDSLA
jgi:HD-like signal output (HDOD) protein